MEFKILGLAVLVAVVVGAFVVMTSVNNQPGVVIDNTNINTNSVIANSTSGSSSTSTAQSSSNATARTAALTFGSTNGVFSISQRTRLPNGANVVFWYASDALGENIVEATVLDNLVTATVSLNAPAAFRFIHVDSNGNEIFTLPIPIGSSFAIYNTARYTIQHGGNDVQPCILFAANFKTSTGTVQSFASTSDAESHVGENTGCLAANGLLN